MMCRQKLHNSVSALFRSFVGLSSEDSDGDVEKVLAAPPESLENTHNIVFANYQIRKYIKILQKCPHTLKPLPASFSVNTEELRKLRGD